MAAYLDGHAAEMISKVSDRAQARPASSMEQALSELAEKVSAAELGMERLADKLRPVLSSRELECGGATPCPAPNCELEERILQLAHHVESLAARMSTTTNQLCV